MGFTNKFHIIYLTSLLTLTILAIHHALCHRPLINEELIMVQKREDWMAQHGRVYKDGQEKERRFGVFRNNFEYIEKFNNGVDRGYKLAINKFADISNEEFRSIYTGYKRQNYSNTIKSTSEETSFTKNENLCSILTSLDWRKKGAVTHVKDQGQCGR